MRCQQAHLLNLSECTNYTYLRALTTPICVISELEGALRDKKESDEMLTRAGIFSSEYNITTERRAP